MHKTITRDQNKFTQNIGLDLPRRISESYSNEADQIILDYFLERNTYTKKLLLKKAIIGLYPNKILGKVIWNGEL